MNKYNKTLSYLFVYFIAAILARTDNMVIAAKITLAHTAECTAHGQNSKFHDCLVDSLRWLPSTE